MKEKVYRVKVVRKYVLEEELLVKAVDVEEACIKAVEEPPQIEVPTELEETSSEASSAEREFDDRED